MSSYIDSINQAVTASTTQSTSSTSDDSVMGKEDFLTLLVAQLQNQDPLNPDDPTEFTAQLAQFSSLEQLYNLNDSMDALVEASDTSDNLSTLSTIGKEVTYYGSEMKFGGEAVTLGYQLDGTASEVTISIQQNGSTVATLDGDGLSEGYHYLNWDGTGDNGKTVSNGTYDIIVSAASADGESVAVASVVRAEVTGVDLDGDDGTTLFTTFGEVSFSNVLGVYEPDSESFTSSSSSTDEEDGDDADEQGVSDTMADVTDTTEDTTDQVGEVTS